MRILGIQFFASLSTHHTWDPLLANLPAKLRFWNGIYPSILSKVAILNSFVCPSFLYHANILPPSDSTLHSITDHFKQFISLHRSHLLENTSRRGLYLFNLQTIFSSKQSLGLGVLHPAQRTQAQNARWIHELLIHPTSTWKQIALATMQLPFCTPTFLCHPLIATHLSLPPRSRSYFAAFLSTSSEIKPTPLTSAVVALSPLPFNRETLLPTGQPFGAHASELFLLHRQLTVDQLANLLMPTPFTSPPPARLLPAGYSRAEAFVLRRLWRAIPPAWKPLITSLTVGPNYFGVPSPLRPSWPSTIYEISARPDSLLSRLA